MFAKYFHMIYSKEPEYGQLQRFAIQDYQVDGLAADWHPTEKTHTKVAAKLTEKIKEIMSW